MRGSPPLLIWWLERRSGMTQSSPRLSRSCRTRTLPRFLRSVSRCQRRPHPAATPPGWCAPRRTRVQLPTLCSARNPHAMTMLRNLACAGSTVSSVWADECIEGAGSSHEWCVVWQEVGFRGGGRPDSANEIPPAPMDDAVRACP